MSFDKDYANRSDTKKGFEDKIKRQQDESFGGRTSRTGYTDTLIGMDDLNRVRRVRTDKKINS